jgi:hypothetical protein
MDYVFGVVGWLFAAAGELMLYAALWMLGVRPHHLSDMVWRLIVTALSRLAK